VNSRILEGVIAQAIRDADVRWSRQKKIAHGGWVDFYAHDIALTLQGRSITVDELGIDSPRQEGAPVDPDC
jgi:hypothetical protein